MTGTETRGVMGVEQSTLSRLPRIVLLGTGIHPEVVYLAGPYRPYVDEWGKKHGIAENVREAGQFGIEIWKRGYVALVPHTLTYLSPKQQKQDGGIAGVSPETFMSGELELIRRSDMVVLMPNWRYSRGAREEKLYAETIGVPVLEWADFLVLGRVA